MIIYIIIYILIIINLDTIEKKRKFDYTPSVYMYVYDNYICMYIHNH
jgi:hypothetical protein